MIPAALRLPDDALLRNPSAGSPSGTNRKTSIDMHQQQKHNGASRQTVDARFLRWVQTVNTSRQTNSTPGLQADLIYEYGLT